MKTILTIILAFVLLGCGSDDMAHIGEEIKSSLTATNVTDDTQVYSDTIVYADGDIVLDGDFLKIIKNIEDVDWDIDTEYKIDGIVLHNGLRYKSLYDMPYYPSEVNTKYSLIGTALKRDYEWFLEYGDWDGDGTVITKQLGVPTPVKKWEFTLTDGNSYSVDISIDGGAVTTETWTIHGSYNTSLVEGKYFIFNGKLYEVLVQGKYSSPDIIILNRTAWDILNYYNYTLTQIGYINQLKPFDGQNITPAISSSPMTYKITGSKEFNAFTLAKVLASSVTYTFRNSGGSIVKSKTMDIDCNRDKDGILSKYPTTVAFYADEQMPIGSTVEITLTHDDDIELGDFTLNNMIDAGFTNKEFSNAVQDYNDNTPDEWGQIPESVKAVVTRFDISMDIYFTNYSNMVSFQESISGKNVTVDGSDSNINSSTAINSLTRRVRVTSPVISSKVKDNEIGRMALFKFTALEIV